MTVVSALCAGSECHATPPGWPFPLYFDPAVQYSLAGLAVPRAVAVGDFNEDGVPDLVTVGNNDSPPYPLVVESEAWVYLGSGGGSFAPAGSFIIDEIDYFSSDPILRWVATADINLDGHLDILTLSTNRLWIHLGDGDGTFHPDGVLWVWPGVGDGGARSIAVADFDGDADTDLAVTIIGFGGVKIFRNEGGSSFVEVAYFALTGGWGGGYFIAATDIDADGDIDLVAPGYSSNTLFVLRNNGAGNFSPEPHQVSPSAGSVVFTGVAAGDLDDDGDADVVVADLNGKIWLFENIGEGVLVKGAPLPAKTPLGSGGPWDIVSADFNGDGRADIAFSAALGGGIRLMANETEDELMFGFAVPYATGGFPHAVLAANLDGDCDFDLVVSNVGGESISVLLNETSATVTCSIADLTGDAAVDMMDVVHVVQHWGNLVSAADLNYDGIVNGHDLATVLSNWDPAP